MTMVSKNFKRAEFACRCGCGFDTVDVETLAVLQAVRDHFDRPVLITSGCRCPAHNARVGGSKNSLHMQGRAADFKVIGIEPKQVFDWLSSTYPNQYGFGLYRTWVHVDTRTNGPARW